MTAAVALALLLILAVTGAGGVLLCRRPAQCCAAFILCCAALAGVYGFLDLRFAAIVQAAVGVGLCGLVFIIVLPWFERQDQRTGWYALTVVPLLALITWVLSRSAVRDLTAGPPLPMWAVAGSHLAALGREWIGRHAVLLILLGLLLLTSLVGVAYLIRDRRAPFPEVEQ